MKYVFALILLSIGFAQQIEYPTNEITKLDSNWYKATAWVEFHDNITKSQAKENATNEALKKIIEFHSGVKISSTALSILGETNQTIDIDHFSQIINSMSQGLILDKTIISTAISTVDNYPIYAVTLKAKVGQLTGTDDPYFKIDASLNRDNYQDGDEMIINISTTKDCFIFVFNIFGDNTVASLLPNQHYNNNFLPKGKTLQLPPQKGEITKFRVGLIEGKKQATELIMVLAIKPDNNSGDKNFDFNMGNYTQTLNELMNFMMLFDKNKIKQINLPYVVVSRK